MDDLEERLGYFKNEINLARKILHDNIQKMGCDEAAYMISLLSKIFDYIKEQTRDFSYEAGCPSEYEDYKLDSMPKIYGCKSKKCVWKYNGARSHTNRHRTQCEREYSFSAGGHEASYNDPLEYCPYCGKEIDYEE
jgi:hypothetical protein